MHITPIHPTSHEHLLPGDRVAYQTDGAWTHGRVHALGGDAVHVWHAGADDAALVPNETTFYVTHPVEVGDVIIPLYDPSGSHETVIRVSSENFVITEDPSGATHTHDAHLVHILTPAPVLGRTIAWPSGSDWASGTITNLEPLVADGTRVPDGWEVVLHHPRPGDRVRVSRHPSPSTGVVSQRRDGLVWLEGRGGRLWWRCDILGEEADLRDGAQVYYSFADGSQHYGGTVGRGNLRLDGDRLMLERVDVTDRATVVPEVRVGERVRLARPAHGYGGPGISDGEVISIRRASEGGDDLWDSAVVASEGTSERFPLWCLEALAPLAVGDLVYFGIPGSIGYGGGIVTSLDPLRVDQHYHPTAEVHRIGPPPRVGDLVRYRGSAVEPTLVTWIDTGPCLRTADHSQSGMYQWKYDVVDRLIVGDRVALREAGEWRTAEVTGTDPLTLIGGLGGVVTRLPEDFIYLRHLPEISVGDRVRLTRLQGSDTSVTAAVTEVRDGCVITDDTSISGHETWRYDVADAPAASPALGDLIAWQEDAGWVGGRVRHLDPLQVAISGNMLATPGEGAVVMPCPQVGDRVRLNPDRNRPSHGGLGIVSTVTSVNDESLIVYCENGLLDGHFAWRYDVVPPVEVGDLIAWQVNERWFGGRVDGLDPLTVDGEAVGENWVAVPEPRVGDLVRPVRGVGDDGITYEPSRVTVLDGGILRCENPATGGYAIWRYDIVTPEPEQPTSTDEPSWAERAERVVAELREMHRRVRALAFEAQDTQSYCGDLNKVLEELGIDDSPAYSGEAVVSVKFTRVLTPNADPGRGAWRHNEDKATAKVRDAITEALASLGTDDGDLIAEGEITVEVTSLTIERDAD